MSDLLYPLFFYKSISELLLCVLHIQIDNKMKNIYYYNI